MLNSRDPADRLDGLNPTLTLRREDLLACWRQPIISPPPLRCLLQPAAADLTAFLELVEQRIERSDVETERPTRTELDQLTDVTAEPRMVFHQRQNQ